MKPWLFGSAWLLEKAPPAQVVCQLGSLGAAFSAILYSTQTCIHAFVIHAHVISRHTAELCSTGTSCGNSTLALHSGHSGFSLHHCVTQAQQNTWPHGVEVGWRRAERQSGHWRWPVPPPDTKEKTPDACRCCSPCRPSGSRI
jgi:hypothetical protein